MLATLGACTLTASDSRWTFNWTANAAGDMRFQFDVPQAMYLMRLRATPGLIAAYYNVTLLDEDGFDLLHGQGTVCPPTTVQEKYLPETTAIQTSVPERAEGLLALVVDAGATEHGQVMFEVEYA